MRPRNARRCVAVVLAARAAEAALRNGFAMQTAEVLTADGTPRRVSGALRSELAKAGCSVADVDKALSTP